MALLTVSPEAVRAYRERYRSAESEVASGLAGRPIVRAGRLAYLGTTSLYGVGSSQYNRIRMPAKVIGGDEDTFIQYRELGLSAAFGSSQFSDETAQALVAIVDQETEFGNTVRYIFGEGVSPRLRKVRSGLEQLGWPSEELLQHGRRSYTGFR